MIEVEVIDDPATAVVALDPVRATAGGVAETAQVDALDKSSVDAHADAVANKAGGIDVSFNAVGEDQSDLGIPLVELSPEDFARPIITWTRTHFLTASAVA